MENQKQGTPNPETNQELGTPNPETKTLTFDEYLSNGGQSEFDKRVEKALNTARTKWEKSQNELLAARDADLLALQEKLKDFDGTKTEFEALQQKYQQQAKEYEANQAKQAYEFSVKTLANEIEFTSKAAKNYFIDQAIKQELKMKDGDILGFNDFVESYKKDDPSAIKMKEDTPPEPKTPEPTFIRSQDPSINKDDNPFNFNFSGVRPHK